MKKLYHIVLLLGIASKAYSQNIPQEIVQAEFIKLKEINYSPKHYQAAKAIVLAPGFSAKGQNTLTAKIQFLPLTEVLKSATLKVSPSPLQEESVIDIKVPKAGAISLGVSSASGEPLFELIRNEYKEAGEYQLSLSSGDWKSGAYIVYLLTSDGIISFKTVKP